MQFSRLTLFALFFSLMLFKSHSDDSDPGMLLSTMLPLASKIKEICCETKTNKWFKCFNLE